ncbi:MAG TPA: homoserine kinase [Bacteroidota bacterium]|nr:homoserine kinase [Bacteroidota bacterium]
MNIKIPASTSNIGPGFDTLGLALNRYLYLSVEKGNGEGAPLSISVEGNGKEHIATDESNLVYQGMIALAKCAGSSHEKSLRGIRLHIKNEIPASGGLGGSGAAIAGGIVLADEFLQTKMSRGEMLNIAVSVEGHPDNVSAALMGGLTINCFDNGKVRCRSVKIPAKLSVVACSPNFQVLTKQARQILPKEVPLKDAVVNIENVASLIASFIQEDFEALRFVTGDKLHEQYRATLIPGFDEVKKAALSAGALSFNISGSGPTVFSFATKNQKEIGAAMVKAFSSQGISSSYEMMIVENEGARVVG